MARARSKSLKRPDVYDALRRKGYSKTKAAKISNGLAKKLSRAKSRIKKAKRRSK